MTNAKTLSRNTGLRQKAQLMSASEIERTLVRLAYEIVEKNSGVEALGLVGIRRRGVPIAERLGKIIARIENASVPVGTLDITFYRDDLSTLGPKPVVQEREIGFPIEDKNIVLVWMTFCSLAAPRERHWTRYFPMAGRDRFNCAY